MQATAKSTLSNLVEEHLTSLVREAACVQRHAKRARFHPTPTTPSAAVAGGAAAGADSHNDNNNNNMGVAGGERKGVLRRRLQAEDINLALQWRGSEKLYATHTSTPPTLVGEELSDRRIDLNEYLKNELQVKPPMEMGLTIHWLAVDGKQPDTITNPIATTTTTNQLHKRRRRMDQEDDDTTQDGGVDDENVSVRQLLPRVLSEELHMYFTRVTLAIERGGVTPSTRHQQDVAIASVSRDAGLYELLPFLIRYVTQQIYIHIGNPEHCRTLVRLVRAILSNPYLHVELHLHQLMPALITCVVAKNLSTSTNDNNYDNGTSSDRVDQNHWSLRREAAEALLQACNMFGEDYITLKARVLQAFCEAINPQMPLTTQFGGIVGITLFGPKAIDAFLLSSCTMFWDAWNKMLELIDNQKIESLYNNNNINMTNLMERRIEVQQCQQALLNALSVYFCRVNPSEKSTRLDQSNLIDVFGEKVLVLQSEEPIDYGMCIV